MNNKVNYSLIIELVKLLGPETLTCLELEIESNFELYDRFIAKFLKMEKMPLEKREADAFKIFL